jgi:hypothetical protein
MRPTVYLLCALALTAPGRLQAQEGDSVPRLTSYVARQRATWNAGRATVHWGKWLVVGAAASFTVMGAHEHENSNREFHRLLAVCRADNADCVLAPDGRYGNATAEQLYQRSIHFDRRARTRLLVGQASLLVAAGLFIADLRHHQNGPGNKPFAPLDVSVNERTGGTRVGVRVTF